MGDLFLHAWDATTDKWIKVQSDANGLLKIDPSEFLENPPVEDEAKKAPTSEWAFDHAANVAAHHTKFTAQDARDSIGYIFTYQGKLRLALNCNYSYLQNVNYIDFRNIWTSTKVMRVIGGNMVDTLRLNCYNTGGGYNPAFIEVHNGTLYEIVAVRPWVTSAISTHKDIANAHHDKYTDTNAKAACNLDGFRYWSRPGNGFIATDPQKDNYTRAVTGELIVDENGIDFMVAVNLPDLCTVTGCIIGGNAGLADKTWTLHRFRHSDMLQGKMATAAGNTEDTTISYSVIYNSTYGYCLHIEDLDITDEIHYARISFTISDV